MTHQKTGGQPQGLIQRHALLTRRTIDKSKSAHQRRHAYRSISTPALTFNQHQYHKIGRHHLIETICANIAQMLTKTLKKAWVAAYVNCRHSYQNRSDLYKERRHKPRLMISAAFRVAVKKHP